MIPQVHYLIFQRCPSSIQSENNVLLTNSKQMFIEIESKIHSFLGYKELLF